VTQIHRPARLATGAASFRSGGRHHSGIPGDIIPLYPGDFVGIRIWKAEPGWPRLPQLVSGKVIHLTDVGDADPLRISQQFVQAVDTQLLGLNTLLR
jgi:hypothetical protein